MTGRTTAARLRVIPVPAPGAEDVVVAGTGPDEGAVFTGTEDGSIFRIARDGDRIDRVARTGGRPLGLELDPDGTAAGLRRPPRPAARRPTSRRRSRW